MYYEFFLKLPKTEYGVYLQGIPNENESVTVEIEPTKTGLNIYSFNTQTFRRTKQLISLQKNEILEFSIEDQTTIENRVSVARLLLVGIFALAWKKKSVEPMAFILIKFLDDIQMEQTITIQSSKPNAFQTFTNIKYNLYKFWKEVSENPNIETQMKVLKTTHDEKIKKEQKIFQIGCLIVFVVVAIIVISIFT
ncbi:hypothetical protein AC804_17690 [Chryseobacterium sp. Hurlbut01]|nr:hypothetical protein AC804_17690 [Chryseobacterium sp. Hurlbut01]